MKVAIVGVGRMGQYHLSAVNKLRKDEEIEEVGVFDVVEDKAKEASAMYGATHLKSLDEIASFKPDLTIIATPSLTHYELSHKLLDVSNLLVEKPVIVDVRDGIELLNKSKKSGHILIPAHIERFNPLIEYMTTIKDIHHIDVKRLSNLNRDYSVYVNVIFDLVLHDLDAVIWSMKPTYVSLKSLNIERNGVIVSSIVSLDLDNYATAVIHASWISPIKLRQYSIIKNQGSACMMDLINGRTDCEGYAARTVDQLLEEDRNAIRAVKGKERPKTTLEEAIRLQRVMDSIMRGGSGSVSI